MTKPSIESRLEALERRQELQDAALFTEKQDLAYAQASAYYDRAVTEAAISASASTTSAANSAQLAPERAAASSRRASEVTRPIVGSRP